VWTESQEREREEKVLDEHRKHAITLEQFKKTDAYKRITEEQKDK
jgi:hypothetical protein